MTTPADLAPLAAAMTAWRRHLHAGPEIAFEEHATAAFVADRLREGGIVLTTGIARTGLVATLSAGTSPRAIALRADLDALAMPETTGAPWASRNPGRMHACGHDGHTAMLLGAALHLARTRAFDGTVHFVFQPAEENAGGGKLMAEEGLFERFPADAVFGLHNMPGLPLGTIAVQDGAALASSDIWEVEIEGRGSHGAKPHQGIDPITAAAAFITALHTIVARSVDPLRPAVVSVGSVLAGDPAAPNVIPGLVRLRGTARAFDPATRDLLEAAIGRIASGSAATFGATARSRFIRRNPPVVNTHAEAALAAQAVRRALGEAGLITDFPPSTAGDDFAHLLARRPGAYVWLGLGPGAPHHNGAYDFNDNALPIGAAWWASLVETALPQERP